MEEGLVNSRFWSQSSFATEEASKDYGNSSHIALPMWCFVLLHKACPAQSTIPRVPCRGDVHPDRHQCYHAIILKSEHFQYQEQDEQQNIDFDIKNTYQHQRPALMSLAHTELSPNPAAWLWDRVSCYQSKVNFTGTVQLLIWKVTVKNSWQELKKLYQLFIHSVQTLYRWQKLGGVGVEITE